MASIDDARGRKAGAGVDETVAFSRLYYAALPFDDEDLQACVRSARGKNKVKATRARADAFLARKKDEQTTAP
jgi:hypothetical protein